MGVPLTAIHCFTHKVNTELDLTKEEYKTSHLLSIGYSITTLDNLDINLAIRVGIISIDSLQPKYIRHSFTVLLLDVQNNFIKNASQRNLSYDSQF